ncbi:hypothetical protein [Serratia fonticola]
MSKHEGLTMSQLAERNAELVTELTKAHRSIEALHQQAVKDGNRIAELEQRLQQSILLPRVAAIYANLSDVGRHRTSPENVRDVVDAIQAHADSKVKGAAE